MGVFCWMFGHKLRVINTHPLYRLDKVLCFRCSKVFAMHHPTKYFHEWDDEDQALMDELPPAVCTKENPTSELRDE